MNRKYEVLEKVRQVIIRERRWHVDAISEQDAIRAVRDGTESRCYRGEKRLLDSSEHVGWFINNQPTDYRPAEAVPVDDGIADIGGGG